MTKMDDEILTAYADGELDREKAAEVRAALAQDAEAAETVRRFQELSRLAREAFDEPLRGSDAWNSPR